MLRADYSHRFLKFREVAITSRQKMTEKETFFIKIYDDLNPERFGVGECALFRGLSSDDTPEYEQYLADICRNINRLDMTGIKQSSIRFGVETALLDLTNGGNRMIFDNSWSRSESETQINGLIWMGDKDTMYRRIVDKLERGFRCVKLKIGGIDFKSELALINFIRDNFNSDRLQLRLDANGAFTSRDALHFLDKLAIYDIHSIEQPIRQGQRKAMGEICRQSPIPIALDEELIGTLDYDAQCYMLDEIMPQYIILKPSLCGGFANADLWIKNGIDRGIGWWATSALESNIGLNAISQWVANYSPTIPQGLGTGALYLNNIPSPMVQERDILRYDQSGHWDLSSIEWNSL